MSILTFHSPSFPSRARGAAGLWATVAAAWGHTVQQWRYRQADHALHGMSDAMLHDIGVARSEIADVTRHGRADRR